MKSNLNLMAKELTKLYGREQAKDIMLTHKNNLWTGKESVAYALGKRSLKFFTLYYLEKLYTGEGKAELSQSHYELMDIVTKMFIEDTHKQQNNLLPRGYGKTSVISVPVSIWANLYGYSTYTVIGSSLYDTATSFISTIREGLSDNPKIDNTWGNLLDNNLINTVSTIELSNGSMIQAKSSRSSFRGMTYKGNRITLLILDDYQSEDNTSNKEQMEKHYNQFIKNVLPAVEKHNYRIIANGTTQKRGDFYNRLEHSPTWKTYKRPAILEDTESLFHTGYWQQFKEILFSGKETSLEEAKAYYKRNKDKMEYRRVWDYFDCLELALSYYSNTNAFMQEYQLELDNDSRAIIHTIHTLPKEIIDTKGTSNSILSIDPAGLGADGDYFAFAIGNYDKDNNKYIRYMSLKRFTDFERYIDYIIKLLKEYEDIDTLLIEKNTYSGSDISTVQNRIKRDMDLYYREMTYINEMQRDNKQAKIESVSGQINQGKVKFNATNDYEIRQIKGFINVDVAEHDDMIDAVAELILYIDKYNLEEPKTIQVFDRDLL